VNQLLHTGLIPLFTGTDSGKGLSWPIGTEVLHSYLELFVFMNQGAYLRKFAFGLEMLDMNPHLLSKLAEFNHRKQFLSRLFLLPQNLSWEATSKRFSNNRMNIRGVALRWISCVDLDMEQFQRVRSTPFREGIYFLIHDRESNSLKRFSLYSLTTPIQQRWGTRYFVATQKVDFFRACI
jgi:hypothetical protein